MQMIEYYRENEKSFERLLYLSSFPELDKDTLEKYYPIRYAREWEILNRSMFENDSLYYYHLFPFQEDNDDIRLLSRAERGTEQKQLMEKLNIRGCGVLSPYRIYNSIRFDFYYRGGTFKGYEYVYDRLKEEDDKKFIKPEEDLSVIRRKRPEKITLYKKIGNNWNLFISF
jgi:hypothetical protein